MEVKLKFISAFVQKREIYSNCWPNSIIIRNLKIQRENSRVKVPFGNFVFALFAQINAKSSGNILMDFILFLEMFDS